MLKILQFVFNPFQENTYVVYDPESLECAIVDPGMMEPEEEEALAESIKRHGLVAKHLINTHMHVDHACGNGFVASHYGLEPQASAKDAFLGKRLGAQAQMFGLHISVADTAVKRPLEEGDKVKVGSGELRVIMTPGHTPGGLCLYAAEEGFLLTGDTIFQGSVGRTDLPGGDSEALMDSVKRVLGELPESVDIFPGHGGKTTVGFERRYNPFMR